ncbi:helix-turn-helix domain-containing protein, partial [Bifidobacterium mongoliense]|uniref:helix-turn-helix domain-containing protein n=1 Tax=Bifidobacterium mongoliense TaxID=518643 RepID=UPI00264A41FF
GPATAGLAVGPAVGAGRWGGGGGLAAVPPIVLLAITHLTVILTRKPDDNPLGTPSVEVYQVPAPVPDAAPGLAPTRDMPELGQASGESEAPIVENAENELPAVESPSDRRKRAWGLREAGWSNKRIARQLGVHASTVGRWFTGKRPSNVTESEKSGDES